MELEQLPELYADPMSEGPVLQISGHQGVGPLAAPVH